MKSLRRQLTETLGLAICTLLVTGGLGIFFVTRGVLGDQFDDTLVAKATALISATEIDDGEFEVDMTVQDFAGFGSGGQDYFEIRRQRGTTLTKSPSIHPSSNNLLIHPELPDGPEARIFSDKLGDGRSARFYIQKFVPKDDFNGTHQDLYLIAASPTRDLQYSLWVLGSVIAGVEALVLIVTIPLIRMLLARGLRPLASLGKQVKDIPPSRLDQRLDLAGQPEELVPLGSALNAWLERLEESFERERRFSSHAAHELRTPLAELKMMAELGATWPDQATPERCMEMVKVTDELEALLDKLSLLARADAGSQPVERVAVDLQTTVSAGVERFSQAAAARNLTITAKVESGDFRSDPVLWSTILQNLLGNAVSHAPAGSTIVLSASPSHLRTENPAPDLEGQDLEHLFERFWRKNPSHREEAHSGLGLSIIRACVGLLGGTSKLALDQDRLLKVEIIWPVR